MIVEVRRYASLGPSEPGRLPGEPQDVALEDGATIARLFEELGLAPEAVHLVIVDGRICHDREKALRPGARVAIFPPVGGG